MAKSVTTIQSLQVGWEIVEVVARHHRPMKSSEIYDMTQISKSNLYKYLNTLTLLHILYRDKASGMYSLGSKLIEYGMQAMNQEDIVERASPYLQDIHQTCKQTVILTTWTHNGPVAVKLFNSQQGLNIGCQIGTVLPLATATGRIFAAFSDDLSGIQQWKLEQLAQLDSQSRQQFEQEIRQVRETSISFAKEPLVPSVSSIALPIFNFGRKLIGSFVVVGFDGMLPNGIEDEVSLYLLRMSRGISGVFGYARGTNDITES